MILRMKYNFWFSGPCLPDAGITGRGGHAYLFGVVIPWGCLHARQAYTQTCVWAGSCLLPFLIENLDTQVNIFVPGFNEALLLCEMLGFWRVPGDRQPLRVCLAEDMSCLKVECRHCPAQGSGKRSKRPTMAIKGVLLGTGPKTGHQGKGLECGIFVFYFFIVVLEQCLFL